MLGLCGYVAGHLDTPTTRKTKADGDGRFQRNLNNAFAYDLVPSTSVVTAALKAARRVNDFPTAVRIFEGALPLLQCPPSSSLCVLAGLLRWRWSS